MIQISQKVMSILIKISMITIFFLIWAVFFVIGQKVFYFGENNILYWDVFYNESFKKNQELKDYVESKKYSD